MLEHFIVSFIISSDDTGEQVKAFYVGVSEGLDMTAKRNYALCLYAQQAEEIVLWLRQSKFPGMSEVKIELASTIDDNSDLEMVRRLIKEYIDAEKYNAALAYSDSLINMTPELSFDDWFKRGYCHFMLNQHEEAISSYQNASAMEPYNFQALSNIAISMLLIGRANEGFEYFQKALSINPNIAPAWLHVGYYYITLSNENDLAYEKAVNAFRRAIQLVPQFAEYKVQATGNDNDVTIKYIVDISSEVKDISDEQILSLSWYDRAVGFSESNELDESLDCYIKHLEGDPQDYRALNNMGAIKLNKGLLNDAINLFLRATEIKKDYDVGWYNLSKAYREKGDYSSSIECCKMVIKINSEYNDVWTNLGNNYLALDMHYEALASYNQAVKVNSRDYRAYYNKGKIEINLGLHAESIDSLEMFIETAPDTLVNLKNEALLLLSEQT